MKMKKLFIVAALFGFSTVGLTGCGGSKPAEVESVVESDSSMSADQRAQYEEQMKSGGSSQSSQPGN
jgi:hypothetical protein